MRRRPPTDFEILKEIYTRHRDEYADFVKGAADGRAAKIAVPIDLQEIANRLGVDVDSVFGRLYYHLDPKYGEEPDGKGGPRKMFFSPVVGPDRNCVNFPLLEAVLAGLWQQRWRDRLAITTAVFSLVIAVASIVVSAVTA